MIAVHVTHEAVEKMGGIGAVIAGLTTSKRYQKEFGRTILLGPLLTTDRTGPSRLGPGGKVLYSSLDDIDVDGWSTKFKPIEQTYQAGIIYGTRLIHNDDSNEAVEVEVLLVDVFRCNKDRLNLFKGHLFTRFGIPSDRFEKVWEYEQYVRLAEPGYEALHVIGCQGSPAEPMIILAHEYMGMPTAMKAMMDGSPDVRTVFYAHEVASVRGVVEDSPGHDLMFYTALEKGEREGGCLEDYFPEVRANFKHPIIKAARQCDAIFAVGDLVGQEMRFTDPACRDVPVEMVYNGVPADQQTLAERQAHRGRMIEYARNLFGFRPDYIFTHVARPVLSKGIWRDLRTLHELEPIFKEAGKSAVFFMLGTLAGQRAARDVLHMERVYGWPVHHVGGYPDLCNGEETIGGMCEEFNRNHERIRAVLVNQFGWEQRVCGLRMPEDMTLPDVRRGTDVEFGMSIYEPFGISQFEALAFGGICVVSNVCGCMGFVRRCCGDVLPPNVLEADFIHVHGLELPEDPRQIGMGLRDQAEALECRRLAYEIGNRLPKDDAEMAALLASGWGIGRRISWDRVVTDLFLPAVARTLEVDQLSAVAPSSV